MKKFLFASLSALVLSACGGKDDVLTVAPDGTVINLRTSAKGWVSGKGDNNGTITGYNQGESFYGVWSDDSKALRYAYAYGTELTNMPTSGEAEYNGQAIRMDANGNPYIAGTSKFGVDFTNKLAVGTIDMKNGADVLLDVAALRSDGSINGTAVALSGVDMNALNNASTANAIQSALGSAKIESRGTYKANLHGNGASQVSGVADFNNTLLNTAFGGTR